MTNLITRTKTAPKQKTETNKSLFSFETEKFNDLKKNLLSDKPLNPAADLKKFEEATKARRYDFFSSQSLQNWKDVFGNLDYADILQMALVDTKLFLKNVQNPASPLHDWSRTLFSSFDSNEEKLRQYFLNKNCEENGYNDRPFRNLSHEGAILKLNKPLSSNHAIFEYETMKKLFTAKWAAIGYSQDKEYKEKFINDYCIIIG